MNDMPVYAVVVINKHLHETITLFDQPLRQKCANTYHTEECQTNRTALLSMKQFTKHNTWIVEAIFLLRNQCYDSKIMLKS